MVWKDQVYAAAVNIDAITHQRMDHGRALDVPAWPTLAPWRRPGRLAWLCWLPKCEIHRIALFQVDFHARPGLQIVDVFIAELSITREAANAVQNLAVGRNIGLLIRD